MRSIASVVAVLMVFIGAAAAQKSKDERVRLMIFTATDASGFTDQTTKDRTDAVSDAIKSLGRSKLIDIVTKREDAQVVVEITRRVKELAKTSIGKSMWKNNSWSRSPDSMQPFLYGTLTVVVGGFSTELKSPEPESTGQGRKLAGVVEQWVKDNHEKLRGK